MNKRYSTKPKQYGDIGFQWKTLPDQEILFTELKDSISKIEISLNKLPGVKAETKPEDFAKVNITYGYVKPGETLLTGFAEAEEEIYGPQDKVYQHILSYYPQAAKMFINTWNIAKHKKLRSLTNIRSPFSKASTAQKLSEEFYKAKMDPKAFAEKLKKDKANIYNELKGKRKISVDQAIEYSKEFGCDPVNLLFEDLTTECWGNVDLLKSQTLEETYHPGRIRAAMLENAGSFYYGKYYADVKKAPDVKKAQAVGRKQRGEFKYPIVKVPRDIYAPDIKAIKIDSKGSYLNNYIAYYYFSKNQNKSAHGKLAVVGQEWINDDLGIQETYYWFGIYEEKIGGGANILNPDPLAKDKYIAKNLENITFVSPVVSIVHPSTLKEDSAKREALRWTDKIFEEQQELNKIDDQINEFKKAMDKMTAAQKKLELNVINEIIDEQRVKADQSFLKNMFGKKAS